MQLKNRYKRDKTKQFKRENQKEATNCCCKAKCNAFVQYLKLSIEVRENKIKLLKLKRYKLKVIYFIGITFYYFSTAIYFTVFYSTEFLFLLDMMEVCKKEREREQRRYEHQKIVENVADEANATAADFASQTINNFFNFIYQIRMSVRERKRERVC